MPEAYKLVSSAGDQSIDVKPGQPLVVGRAVTSDVPIFDPTISRAHAQVTAVDGGVQVKDLGSSNGTFLNGSRITEAVAAPNDVVTFGKVAFHVREAVKRAAPPTPAPAAGAPAAPKPSAGATIVRQVPLGEELALISGRVPKVTGPAVKAEEVPLDEAAKRAKGLQVLLEVSKALSRQQDVDKLLQQIADFSFQVMAVDRVSVQLGATTETLVPRVFKSRLEAFPSAAKVPSTILGPVMQERVALLIDNVAEDEKYKGKTSMTQAVRSAMGAPLLTSDGSSLGVLYVDSLTAKSAYSADDLDFLVGFASVASAAIENNQLSQRVQREALVLSNIQRYFSPDLAKTIAEHGEEVRLGGAKRDVVILFSDIRGFTSMSEKMEPDDVAHLLRDYFTEMVEIIFRHGGTLDKFIGDAIMALWGAPLGTEDDADKAMLAAIEMQRALGPLNEHWEASGKPRIAIGLGINCGQVFAGNIGSEQRLEYTVLGDAVNTASRLCSNAARGEIMVSEPFYRRLKNPPPTEPRDPIKVKGKEQPVPIYLVKY